MTLKTPSFFLVSILSFVLAPAAVKAAVTLTGFGTGQYAPGFTDFTTQNQTATAYQLVGTDGGSSAFGDLPLSVNISGSTSFVTLVATFTGTASTAFGIELFDTGGNSRLYSANFSSFTQNVLTSVNFSFVAQTGAFNNQVVGLGFSTSGPPSSTSTINITMDTLLAAPEPSSMVLLGLSMAGLLSHRWRTRLS